MKIYTKKGDQGNSYLGNGQKVPKSDFIFHLLGNLDELNASLGFLHTINEQKVRELIFTIQNDLLDAGAYLGKGKIKPDFSKKTKFYEKQIDELEKSNMPLKNFILPGGVSYSAQLHLARAICRRAERSLAHYYENEQLSTTQENLRAMLNRLSDLLFVLARYVNLKNNKEEIIYQSKK